MSQEPCKALHPEICKNKEDFRFRQARFIRDKSIQGIKVTFKRDPNGEVVCLETGNRWVILSSEHVCSPPGPESTHET